MALHAAGISHGEVDGAALSVQDDGRVLITDLADGQTSADDAAVASDDAHMLVTTALAVGVASVTATEIDRLNIRQASLAAMARAVGALALTPAYVLVDGRDRPPLSCPSSPIIKGDSISLSIAAASIVAKVARDGMMRQLATLYPDYGFETNAGYAAKRHLAALDAIGPTPIHRFSFAPLSRRNADKA